MKKIIQSLVVILFVVSFSGCTLLPSIGKSGGVSGGVLKSIDNGKVWEFKNKAGEDSSIASLNILSIVINPNNPDNIYIGTESKGVIVTDDGGENWRKIDLAVDRVYSLSISGDNIYVGGSLNKRGRIFKSQDSSESWEEVYIEPSSETVITSIIASQRDAQAVYAGTSAGMIFKTVDGGASWQNLHESSGPVTSIILSGESEDKIFALVFNKGVLVSNDGGINFETLDRNGELKKEKAFSLAVDESGTGAVYLGTNNGIFKTVDDGNDFVELNILSSSAGFPIRAIAVDPSDSRNIIYSSQQVIYSSEDGGVNWSTFQVQGSGYVSNMVFDSYDLGLIYATIRKSN
ncbi:WD40/YVTN/BNR-like repeat-containing protein [Patescibacteria group bacterium]